MKLWSETHSFPFPWTVVSRANWIKYPNPLSPHVVNVDYLDRRIERDGTLCTERILNCRQNIPAFISKFMGSEDCLTSLVHEESIVDPKTNTLTINARNLNLSNFISIHETCTYTPDPLNPGQSTILKQEAKIEFTGFAYLGAFMVEEFCMSRFIQNARKGRDALIHVLENITQ